MNSYLNRDAYVNNKYTYYLSGEDSGELLLLELFFRRTL